MGIAQRRDVHHHIEKKRRRARDRLQAAIEQRDPLRRLVRHEKELSDVAALRVGKEKHHEDGPLERRKKRRQNGAAVHK
jgi:hypothetical protein